MEVQQRLILANAVEPAPVTDAVQPRPCMGNRYIYRINIRPAALDLREHQGQGNRRGPRATPEVEHIVDVSIDAGQQSGNEMFQVLVDAAQENAQFLVAVESLWRFCPHQFNELAVRFGMRHGGCLFPSRSQPAPVLSTRTICQHDYLSMTVISVQTRESSI